MFIELPAVVFGREVKSVLPCARYCIKYTGVVGSGVPLQNGGGVGQLVITIDGNQLTVRVWLIGIVVPGKNVCESDVVGFVGGVNHHPFEST